MRHWIWSLWFGFDLRCLGLVFMVWYFWSLCCFFFIVIYVGLLFLLRGFDLRFFVGLIFVVRDFCLGLLFLLRGFDLRFFMGLIFISLWVWTLWFLFGLFFVVFRELVHIDNFSTFALPAHGTQVLGTWVAIENLVGGVEKWEDRK